MAGGEARQAGAGASRWASEVGWVPLADPLEGHQGRRSGPSIQEIDLSLTHCVVVFFVYKSERSGSL